MSEKSQGPPDRRQEYSWEGMAEACAPRLQVLLKGISQHLETTLGILKTLCGRFFFSFFNLKLEPTPAPFALVFGGNQHISTQEMLTEHYVLQTETPGNIVKERSIVSVDYLH